MAQRLMYRDLSNHLLDHLDLLEPLELVLIYVQTILYVPKVNVPTAEECECLCIKIWL